MENISSTTWLLLSYSKSAFIGSDYQDIKTILSAHYHYEMDINAVMSVCMGCVHEVVSEPRFEVHFGSKIFTEIVIAPIDRSIWHLPAEQQLTPEEFYSIMINKIISCFRYTRVDWCRDKIFKYEEPNNV